MVRSKGWRMAGTNADHLTGDEIAGLIGAFGPAEIPAERVDHARFCAICSRWLTMHEEEQRRLNRLAGGPRTGPRSGCPPSGELASLAAGLLDAARRDALLDHAAGCDSCGATLRALVEDFADETSHPESRMLDSLESSKPEWQLGMASRMARRGRVQDLPHGRRESYPPLWGWLARAAAVIAAVFGGCFGWNTCFAAKPERLLAAAYTEQRPFL